MDKELAGEGHRRDFLGIDSVSQGSTWGAAGGRWKIQRNGGYPQLSTTASEKSCTDEWKSPPPSIEGRESEGPVHREYRWERMTAPCTWPNEMGAGNPLKAHLDVKFASAEHVFNSRQDQIIFGSSSL